MNKYKVEDIMSMFGIFLDEEVEAESYSDAQEIILNEIIDNIGNYIEIELVKVEDDKDE